MRELWRDLYLVALDAATGEAAWERPLETAAGVVVFQMAYGSNVLVIVSSNDKRYDVYGYNAFTGERVWRFYPKRAAEVVRKVAQLAGLLLRLELLQRRVQREAAHTPYTDAALTPDTEQLDWSSEAAARPPSQPVPLRVTSAANAPERDRASA